MPPLPPIQIPKSSKGSVKAVPPSEGPAQKTTKSASEYQPLFQQTPDVAKGIALKGLSPRMRDIALVREFPSYADMIGYLEGCIEGLEAKLVDQRPDIHRNLMSDICEARLTKYCDNLEEHYRKELKKESLLQSELEQRIQSLETQVSILMGSYLSYQDSGFPE